MSVSQFLQPNHEINFDTPNRVVFLKQDLLNSTDRDLILGRGSYGVVIKGTYKDKPVAVKVLEKCQQHKIDSLNNEFNILDWQHKNIIKIIKIINEPQYGLGYIIMELYDGQCLQNIVDQFVIPLFHRLWILVDIISALNYCHSHCVIHLDIKPQNVIVTTNKQPNGPNFELRKYVCKLCDFGSSVKVNTKLMKRCQKGTIRYMAPEALQDCNVTYSADIYAFGVTMWQIKENKIPYHDIESNDIVAYAVVKNNLRPDTVNFSTNCISKFFLSKENTCFQEQKVQKTSIRSTDLKIQVCNPNPSMCWLEDKENLAPDEKICSSPEILMDVPIFFSKNFVQNKQLWKPANKVKIQIEREPSCLELFTGPPQKRSRKLSDNFDVECMFDDPWKDNFVGHLENTYKRLYKDCWQKISEKRPSTEQVLNKLNKLFC